MKALLKLLANPAQLHADAKASVLMIIPLLPSAQISNLANHADVEIKTAALLGLEQSPGNPNLKTRVPLATAAAALSSPARRIRRMAAHSLLTPDPADATRAPQGARAILAATNDPADVVAIDALDVLVNQFCGKGIGPGVTTYHDYPGGFYVVKFPTAQEVAVAALMARVTGGPIAGRLAAINQIGAGGPELLAARWDVFLTLLDDPDPQIRAGAFAVARSVTAQAVTARFGPTPVTSPAAPPAPPKR